MLTPGEFGQTQIWRILRALGFSVQKPERRAIERDEEAVRQWKQRTWPALKKSPARRPIDCLHQRIRYQRAPHASPDLGGEGANAGHSVSFQLEPCVGDRRPESHELPVSVVRGQCQEGAGGRVLPPYSPELNPVEYLWAWLKRHAIANFCPNNLDELRTTARNKLKSAQRRPSIITACWIQASLW